MLFTLLSACGQDYGNKLESNEIDIYFTNQKDEELARAIALYWKENHLLGEKKQFLQLERKGKTFELKLIPTEKFNIDKLSFDERSLLLSLQKDLQKLTHSDKLEVVIADSQFNTLFNIN